MLVYFSTMGLGYGPHYWNYSMPIEAIPNEGDSVGANGYSYKVISKELNVSIEGPSYTVVLKPLGDY